MMIEIALATAVALNGPEPKGTWLDGNDVLTSELELGKPKYVWIRLLISPSGELQSCDIERSS